MIREAFFGEFRREQFDYSPRPPLSAPFSSDHWDPIGSRGSLGIISLSSPSTVFASQQSIVSIYPFCAEESSCPLDMELARRSYDVFLHPTQAMSAHIAMIIPTDSANSASLIHGGNPRSLDKHSRIHM